MKAAKKLRFHEIGSTYPGRMYVYTKYSVPTLHSLTQTRTCDNSTSFRALFLLAFACVRLVICLRLRVRVLVLQVAAFA